MNKHRQGFPHGFGGCKEGEILSKCDNEINRSLCSWKCLLHAKFLVNFVKKLLQKTFFQYVVRDQRKERGGVIFLVREDILRKGFFRNFGHESVMGYYSFVIIVVINSKCWISFTIFEIGSFFWKRFRDTCY